MVLLYLSWFCPNNFSGSQVRTEDWNSTATWQGGRGCSFSRLPVINALSRIDMYMSVVRHAFFTISNELKKFPSCEPCWLPGSRSFCLFEWKKLKRKLSFFIMKVGSADAASSCLAVRLWDLNLFWYITPAMACPDLDITIFEKYAVRLSDYHRACHVWLTMLCADWDHTWPHSQHIPWPNWNPRNSLDLVMTIFSWSQGLSTCTPHLSAWWFHLL